MDSLQDDFAPLDTAKWAVGKGATVTKLNISAGTPQRLTMLCSGCGRELWTVTPTVQAKMLIFYHVEVECGCGETTIYETRH